MWLERLTYSRTNEALSLAAQFAEQRQRVLAQNLANIDTPDYHSQQLDPTQFQSSLREALDADRAQPAEALNLRGNAQFETDAAGHVSVQPATEPAPNVLFQDGTNARLEGLLSDVSSNSQSYELCTTLLRGRYENLLRAIRGRTT